MEIILKNRAGDPVDCTETPDLWHIAQWIREGAIDDPQLAERLAHESKQILDTWHQCHLLKAEVTRLRKELERITPVADRARDLMAVNPRPLFEWSAEGKLFEAIAQAEAEA